MFVLISKFLEKIDEQKTNFEAAKSGEKLFLAFKIFLKIFLVLREFFLDRIFSFRDFFGSFVFFREFFWLLNAQLEA